jgi:hypothetical protein
VLSVAVRTVAQLVGWMTTPSGSKNALGRIWVMASYTPWMIFAAVNGVTVVTVWTPVRFNRPRIWR